MTICCLDQDERLSLIEDNGVYLSKIGEIVREELLAMVKIRKNVELDEWVIMPNHVHMILKIRRDAINRVCTKKLNKMGCVPLNKNPMANQRSLGAIIRAFKAASSRKIRRKFSNLSFAWQPRFYESIIRNKDHFFRVKKYIEDNPKRWLENQNK